MSVEWILRFLSTAEMVSTVYDECQARRATEALLAIAGESHGPGGTSNDDELERARDDREMRAAGGSP